GLVLVGFTVVSYRGKWEESTNCTEARRFKELVSASAGAISKTINRRNTVDAGVKYTETRYPRDLGVYGCFGNDHNRAASYRRNSLFEERPLARWTRKMGTR
ncbi:hypothetical protein U1Q18_049208, partial [Sarracenia purpurea var. burkii]